MTWVRTARFFNMFYRWILICLRGLERTSLHVFIGDRILHLGLNGLRRCISPLHAELETFLWAMNCLVTISIIGVVFATDCSDLIDMTYNHVEWRSFASEVKYFFVLHRFFIYIKYISHSINIYAYRLAKCSYIGFYFFHINSLVPNWF